MFSMKVIAQTGVLKGTIYDTNGEVLPAAAVIIKECNKISISDTTGNYEIMNLPAGMCDVECKCIGYKKFRRKIQLKPGDVLQVDIQLQDTITELKHIEIAGKSSTQELREHPQSVTVIDAKALQAQSSSPIDIVNRAMGVKVRQAGGLGSDATIYLNGLGGKQVKFFIDGIPSEYLGNGLSIHVLPVSLIDRIEIYKGVVPIELGADALGGALNMVTRKNVVNYIDASYSIGSFNTHKTSLNARYSVDSSHFFASVNSFYNYSDNNYRIDVEIPDQYGVPHKQKMKRFHDQYQNYMVSLENGVINKSWADLLSFTATVSGMYDHVQNSPTNIEQPYGKVVQKENAVGGAIKFRKKNVIKKLDLDFYYGYNYLTSLAADTSIYSYTWDGRIYSFQGKPIVHPFVGEKSGNRKLLHFNINNIVQRLGLKYQLTSTAFIAANIIAGFYERKGFDTIQENYYGRNYFQTPESMFKNMTGIAFEKLFFQKKLTSITSLKGYFYKAVGFEIDQNKEQRMMSQIQSNFGLNQALRFRFTDQILMRTSYEYATRLPDVSEAFGDFLDVHPNPGILPETSHNANAGFLYNRRILKLEINGFYRRTDNIIYLKTSRFFSQNQNLLKAEIKGIETEFHYQPFQFVSIGANATYQDLRNKSQKENPGVNDNRYYNARLPNIPYLFANSEVRFYKRKITAQIHDFQLWWNLGYVHEFYLYWATDGDKDQKSIIQHQLVQNAGMSIVLLEDKLTVCAEAFNISNAKVFDNFNIQKPGRSFSMKLKFFIQKK